MFPMKRVALILCVVLGALTPHCGGADSSAQNNSPRGLRFVRKIGVGWRTDLFGWMGFVSFSSDGTMVASDGPIAADHVSGNLTLWTFPEGRLTKELPGRPTAMSRDWKYYATFHGVWEVDSGRAVISLGDNAYAVHAFSSDGRYVAESPFRKIAHGPHIRVVELESGKQISAFGIRSAVSLAISPDGRTLASGHWNAVKLWDFLSGKRLEVLHGFDRYADGLSFSQDGRFLAAGTDFGKVQIWDLRRGVMLHSMDIGGGQVSTPAFSPDGTVVAVGIYGTGKVWMIDVETGKILDSKKVSDLGCGAVAFSPDGRFLITPSTGGLIKWPYDRGGTIRVFAVRP
jgi:WD40 repeat protein